MKIVQFKNGSYAVRRWSFGFFVFEYLDPVSNYWWPVGYEHNAYYTSLDGAVRRLEKYQEFKSKKPDVGKPVEYKKWNDFS